MPTATLTSADLALTNVPSYAEAVGRLGAMQNELRDVEGEISNLVASASKIRGRNPVADAAEALLGGDRSGLDRPAVTDVNPQLEELQRRRTILTEAIRLQREQITALEFEVSATICGQVKNTYGSTIRDLSQATIAVGHAITRVHELTSAMNDAGLRWPGHLRPMQLSALGLPVDRYSPIAQYLREAAQYGFINPNDIPAEWRKAWE